MSDQNIRIRNAVVVAAESVTAKTQLGGRTGGRAPLGKWAQMRNETVRASLGEHGDLLGLGAEFTRDDVMRAFRQKAHEHHPGKGGDAAGIA